MNLFQVASISSEIMNIWYHNENFKLLLNFVDPDLLIFIFLFNHFNFLIFMIQATVFSEHVVHSEDTSRPKSTK